MSDLLPELPNTVIALLTEKVKTIDAGEPWQQVVARALNKNDPAPSAGIFLAEWVPRDYVMSQYDPAVQAYTFLVMTLVKDRDEQRGRLAHNAIAQRLRLLLYRDNDLHVRLTEISEVFEGKRERVQRFGVRGQRMASSETQGTHVYLAATEIWVETETV